LHSILRATLALLMLTAMLPIAPSMAHAEWLSGGTPVQIAPLPQRDPTLAPDGFGGMFVAWIHFEPFENDAIPQLYMKRLTSDGDLAPGWPADGLLVDTILSAGRVFGNLHMVPDTLGGAYVMWTEVAGRSLPNTLYRPKLQHVLANGTTDPAWPDTGRVPLPQLSASGRRVMVADGRHGVLVLWQTSQDLGPGSMHRVHRLTAAGTPAPGWPDTGIVIGPGEDPQIVPDGSGGVIVALRGLDKLQALHVPAAGGGPDWSGVELRDEGLMQSAVTDGAGGAYVLMLDGGDLYIQRLNANGAISPGWPAGGRVVAAGSGGAGTATMVLDHLRGANVVWKSDLGQMTVQRIDPDGSDGDSWPATGIPLGTGQTFDDVCTSGAGLFVAWQRSVPPNIQVNQVDASGTRPPGWDEDGVVLVPNPMAQVFPRIVSDGANGALVVWTDYRNRETTDTDIYAARILFDATVGVVASLATAEATAERVRLVWWTRDLHEVRIERALDDASAVWEQVATLVPNSAGQVVFEDHAIVAGERYRYRLALGNGSWAGEVSIEVPRALAFALLGARPNPVAGIPVIEFTLDRAGEARLELFDVAGRTVSARTMSAAAGRHLIPMSPTGPLAPGVYLIRIAHAGRTETARMVVAR